MVLIYYEKDLKQVIVLSTIICIGFLGNLLNICVFSHRSMRPMSTFQFLLYLSFVDLFVLLVCSSDALLTYGLNYEIRLYSNPVCRIHTFLTYFLTHMSSMLLMTVSIERVLVVYNKTFISFFLRRTDQRINRKRRKLSSTQSYNLTKIYKQKLCLPGLNRLNRVPLIMISITLLLILIDSHYLIYLNINFVMNSNNQIDLNQLNKNNFQNNSFNYYDGQNYEVLNKFLLNKTILGKKFRNELANNSNNDIENVDKEKSEYPILMCFPRHDTIYNYFLTNIFIWIDIGIYSVLPFVVMFLCTILILIEIRKKSLHLITLNSNNINNNNLINKFNRRISKKRTRKNNQMLILMLTTNAYFIICSLPYFILYFTSTEENSDKNSTVLFVNILAYSNNAVNFILYGFFSEKYRQTVRKLFGLSLGQVKQFISLQKTSPQSNQYVTNDQIISNDLRLLRLNTKSKRNVHFNQQLV